MTHPRDRIVAALMDIAAETPWDEFSISDVAYRAGVSLAEFRDQFPSKGAILAAFSRQIDKAVLSKISTDLADESPKDRLFDVLMRRLDAMKPYRAALDNIYRWVKQSPTAALALNQVATNSQRFMLEAAGISTEGPLGALKVQGLVISFARVVEIWLTDDDDDMAKTMAALDKALDRGGKIVARAETMHRIAAPFCNLVSGIVRLRQTKHQPRIDIRVGTIVSAEPFPQARKPAYKLRIDFGADIGTKTSSAQITKNYTPAQLIGRQIAAVVNFAPRQIGPFMSEVLTLGFPDAANEVVLVAPSLNVPNGARLY
eukprot:gene7306-7377_t